MDDIFWMKKAIELAQEAYRIGEVPVGAIVVKGEEIVGRGWNQPISNNDPSAHAEVVAIRDAAAKLVNYRIPDTTLYVTIEPCTMCLGTIVHARIARVVFGATEPKAGVLCSHSNVLESGIFNHSPDWAGGVCEAECSEIIQEFFRQRRERKKLRKNLSDKLD